VHQGRHAATLELNEFTGAVDLRQPHFDNSGHETNLSRSVAFLAGLFEENAPLRK
jgi:hypothetical protein